MTTKQLLIVSHLSHLMRWYRSSSVWTLRSLMTHYLRTGKCSLFYCLPTIQQLIWLHTELMCTSNQIMVYTVLVFHCILLVKWGTFWQMHMHAHCFIVYWKIFIQSNSIRHYWCDITDSSCPEGSVTVVSDVKNSSLQLVEMCSSEGVWSPVCDSNWTLQDATVVCRELGQGKGLFCYI